jgi:hypothetical protein
MKSIAVLLLMAMLLTACAGHRQPDPSSNDSLSASDSATAAFFPVADYLESAILGIDSMPIAIKKWVVRGHRRDSSFISVPEFNALALQFLPPELRDKNLQKNFTESSFSDKTTQAVTFTYSPIDKDLPLQRVDVVTVPGLNAQRVKSIYLERSRKAGDSAILERLFWEDGKSFQIITTVRIPNASPLEDQVKVIWGEDDAGDGQ